MVQGAIPPAPDLPFFCKAPSALCEEKEQQHTTKEEGGVATTVGREEVWHLGRKVWNLGGKEVWHLEEEEVWHLGGKVGT